MTVSRAPGDTVPRPRTAAGRWRAAAWQLGGLLVILAVWWLVTDVLKLYPAYVFPSPRAVWTEVSYGLWGTGPQDGKLLAAIGGSLRRVLTGYLIAVVLGGVVGLIMGAWPPIRTALGAYLTGIQSVPSIAFVPFAILFLGLNERAVLFVVILEGFIPVALAVSGALLNVPPALRIAGRTLGAHGPALTWRVLLPAAVPNVLTGLRTAWSFAWRALVGGELLIAGSKSLGEQLEVGRNTANVALVLATIIIIGVIGGVFDALLRSLEARVRRDYGLEVAQ
ncbi:MULTISPECIES: ABC transporter permease [Deinococcus]|uniref:ABC transporter permease n=1 Tax=Deinococcus rufus TaxID=2136097 RepID=A0ABV7ZCH7_9DEIO|nr:ABC transporter permease [Deinococcus sp. AB2017081]WQE93785.1 ABC transporter permease [Deinococcus sp. AB2017081]